MRIEDLQPHDVQRVVTLLDEAANVSIDRRPVWLAALAKREPALCGIVQDLLATIDEQNAATEGRVETADLVARGVARALQARGIGQGRRFGPYRILRLLGQGGMGSVWLAERADGLFERKVALKLVHPSLAGSALGARFARERSILAALEHPEIARLLDAGFGDDAQPYMAIEYVEGVALDAYCDENRLTVSQRIALLTRILAAVQHAHQNLVVHRDLKPSNIFVTCDGEVRLLDFGVSKLMVDGHADETELTQIGGRALTPDYASPEQLAGKPVGTASDVYSLGVVLYQLLCGQRPYRLPRESRGALEDAILVAEPMRPSSCDITEGAADHRSTTPRKLRQALAGDLDTIVLKALEKDPVKRYPTADAMRLDLQRHLSGEPVEARRAGFGYRAVKFIGRHRLQIGIGAGIAALLVAAAGVSVRQAQLAREQALVAERENRRAQAVQAFLLDIFKANSIQQPDPQRARQTTARELLDVGARRAAESLKASPEAWDVVLDTLADMYRQLHLGEDAAAMRQLRVEALEAAYGENDARVAEALLAFARDVSQTDQRAQAVPALLRAKRILDRNGDHASETRGWISIESANIEQYLSIATMRRDADTAVAHFEAHPGRWTSLFHALQASARARYLAGEFALAEARHREALALIERNVDGPSAWSITPLVQLAEAQHGILELDDAEQNLRAGLALSRSLNGDLGGPTLVTQAKLGGFLHSTGRREEGMALLDDAYTAIGRPDARPTADARALVHRFRGSVLSAEGRFAESERSLAVELDDLRRHYPDSIPLARTLLLHGAALTALGRFTASHAALDEAWQIWQRRGGRAVEPSTFNRYRLEQARLSLAEGDPDRAEAWLRGMATPATAPRVPVDAIEAAIALADARLQQRRWDEAQLLAREALDQVRGSALRARLPRLEADAALRLGQAEQRDGNLAQARALLLEAVALRATITAPSSPWLAEAKTALADCLQELGERESAQALVEEVAAVHRANTELGRQFSVRLATR